MNWEPKLSHAKLTCKTPGCTASTTLQVYESGTVAKCFMSFATHPTDFDDDHSNEVYEYISVNNATVNTHCKPMATGCGPKAVKQSALYPCMHRQDISQLLSDNNGTLKMSAKISDMVDECPVEDGSLLSAAAEIYCLMEQKEEEAKTNKTEPSHKGVDAYAPLQCTDPGCTANTTVFLDKHAVQGLKCVMNIKVNQTDFDQDLGSVEQVEWLNVGSKQLKANCTPGKNPCKNATNLKDVVHTSYDCVSGEVVNQDAWLGAVNVSAKISDKVDECASQGFLLDAIVEVLCRPNSTTTTAAP